MLTDKEILDWLDSTDEPFVKIDRFYSPTGSKYKGVLLCSRQTEKAVTGNIRDALSRTIMRESDKMISVLTQQVQDNLENFGGE